MNLRHTALALICVAMYGCEQDATLEFAGNTEWDRISVLAEVSERIVDWNVAEGDTVAAGDLLLQLESTRFDSRIMQARNRLAEAEARLMELRHGPRPETIARARAEVESAEAAVVEAELEYTRVAELLARALTSQSSVDQALAIRDQRRAAVQAAQAVLDELLAGTRSEQIEQAVARVDTLEAEIEEMHLTRTRLDVRAPRSGRVDALPFKPGDQPRAGDAVASLLVGAAPYARVFVPANVRTQFAVGDRFSIKVQGIAEPFTARVRTIRSEASFTPYYALTGDDAGRLVYRAELLIEGEAAARLPAGLPLIATPLTATAAGG